ncbi:hypothetical protein PoB_002147800 [Plakobranchus ocellatus]|uniref:Secreted protein n=1 Tax=Plakobranchus ocellatus TaxID=259542 RepID=A0AAV3ZKE2_9GAST|nr:hypothetical protein PoB_002147800 [Plakobranchus ocellatus]
MCRRFRRELWFGNPCWSLLVFAAHFRATGNIRCVIRSSCTHNCDAFNACRDRDPFSLITQHERLNKRISYNDFFLLEYLFEERKD